MKKSNKVFSIIACIVNVLIFVFLWFVVNDEKHYGVGCIWGIINILWVMYEVKCEQKHDLMNRVIIGIGILFLIIALFTLGIYMITGSMP